MSDIQNVETVLHLHYLRQRHGGELSELVVHTASVKYAETTALQAGYERADTPVVIGGKETPINRLLAYQEDGNADRIAEHDRLLTRYGFTRQTVMRWSFDIDFLVRPIR